MIELDPGYETKGDFDFDFTMRLRGGTINVTCEVKEDWSQDYDGMYCDHITSVTNVSWTFDRNLEVELTTEEENLINEKAKRECKEWVNQ